MKRFTEVIKSSEKETDINSFFPEDFTNLIFYGQDNINKYNQALHVIKSFSPSELQYERKITVNYNNTEYIYRISDTHIEINFDFLGCIAKNLWNVIFEQIIQIAKTNSFIILCKNFCEVNNDLLEIFYTYMNTDSLKYIFIVSNISMLPETIINCSFIVPVVSTKKIIPKIPLVDNMIELIKEEETLHIQSLRNLLYDVLIYQYNCYSFIYEVLHELQKEYNISTTKMNIILKELTKNLKLFNNNYRSIYHLEQCMMLFITNVTN